MFVGMEARELRVGNWVTKDGKYYQIMHGIDKIYAYGLDSETLDSHINKSELKDLQPTPLTEEILLKCGFEISNYSDTLFILDLTDWSSIQVHLYKNECAVEFSISKHSVVVEVYNLHQLQNLYFALTGQELEINL